MDEQTGGGGEQRAGRPGIRRDDFVGRVVRDPKEPPNATLLTGFAGDSPEDGHFRLYFDPSLSGYVDVPEEAVLHSQPLPDDQSPLGGSHFWIRSDARLRYPQAPVQQQASFLGGQLLTQHLGGAAAQPIQTIHTIRPTLETLWSPHCTLGCPIPRTPVFPCTFPTLLPPCDPLNTLVFPCIPPTKLQPQCSWICPVPVDINWPQPPVQAQPLMAAQAVSAQCQMSFGPCPTHMLGCPSTSTCPPTDAFGCPRTSTCPPTFMPGCPSSSTCPPGGAQGFAQAPGIGQIPQRTFATICTQIGCHTLGFTCTYIGPCGCYPLTRGPVSYGGCPSAVDACPSAMCGGFGGMPGF